MKQYTAKNIYEWIDRHQCTEFDEDTATYYIHIMADGELAADEAEAAETVTESVDIAPFAEDESPERFYNEFESLDNPEFCALLKDITDKVNACISTMIKRYVVEYTDPNTGATSPIDTIDAPEGYTAEDYLRDCRANADQDYIDMLEAGEVRLDMVED
jgi:hypothetical protein